MKVSFVVLRIPGYIERSDHGGASMETSLPSWRGTILQRCSRLYWTYDRVSGHLLCADNAQNRDTDYLHVPSQVDCKFLPAIAGNATEATVLVHRLFRRDVPTRFDHHHDSIIGNTVGIIFIETGLAFRRSSHCRLIRLGVLSFGFGHLVLSDEVLNEVVPPITLVSTAILGTGPPFQLSVPLVLVPDPVSFPLERLWVRANWKSTSEWLEVLMHVLGPVRWFVKALDREAERTFELGRQAFDRRYGNSLWKLGF